MSRPLSFALVFIAATCLVACATTSRTGSSSPPRAGSTLRDCPQCPELVVLPQGRFTMGSSEDERQREEVPAFVASWEAPQREVAIAQTVAIGRYEITRGQFAEFVRESGRTIPDGCKVFDSTTGTWRDDPGRSWRSPGFDQTDMHPVVCIAWADAKAYTDWLSRRTGKPYMLASRAIWEFAARSGTASARYWGDDRSETCRYANVADESRTKAFPAVRQDSRMLVPCNDGFARTAPVGSFAPNAFGVHDILGNVWEFTEDCFTESLERLPVDGSAYVAESCNFRTLAGGSYSSRPSEVRAAQRGRGGDPQTYRTDYIGFRVLRWAP